MPSARGFVKSSGEGLVGTFNVNGGARYLSVDVNLPNQLFECSNAILTYNSIAELIEHCSWSGTIGKVTLRMNLGEGVSITGPLDAPRPSSVRARGSGTWRTTATAPDQRNSAGRQQESGRNASADRVQLAPVSFDVPKDPRELERERWLLESGAPIIVIMGQSGTGKSSFINLITSDQQKIGKGIQSCTSSITVIEATVGGKRVVVVDTPGIDDTRPGMTETDILVAIACRLEAMGRNRVWVTGVLFLHRITDNKFSPTASRISNMLKSLCGDEAMRHVMLCTTMWDKVSAEEGGDRFDELCSTGSWEEMISKGANTGQISNISHDAQGDAENIVSELITNAQPVELAIQDEMINHNMSVAETGAGQVLTEHLREVREAAEREMQEIRENMRKQNAEAAAKAKEALLAQEREVERLKRVTEEQTRAARASAERIRQEQEKAEREMEELRDRMRTENAANAARLQEEMRARQREAEERRREAEEQARAQQAHAERLQQERQEADRRMRELQETMRAESQANAARIAEATAAQQREIAELRRQNERLAEAQPAYPWWMPVIDAIGGIVHRVLDSTAGRGLGAGAGGIFDRGVDTARMFLGR